MTQSQAGAVITRNTLTVGHMVRDAGFEPAIRTRPTDPTRRAEILGTEARFCLARRVRHVRHAG